MRRNDRKSEEKGKVCLIKFEEEIGDSYLPVKKCWPWAVVSAWLRGDGGRMLLFPLKVGAARRW